MLQVTAVLIAVRLSGELRGVRGLEGLAKLQSDQNHIVRLALRCDRSWSLRPPCCCRARNRSRSRFRPAASGVGLLHGRIDFRPRRPRIPIVEIVYAPGEHVCRRRALIAAPDRAMRKSTGCSKTIARTGRHDRWLSRSGRSDTFRGMAPSRKGTRINAVTREAQDQCRNRRLTRVHQRVLQIL